MLINYWYFLALGAMFSIVTITLNDIILASCFFFWLLFLFVKRRIPITILLLSFLSFIFFYHFIPSIETGVASDPDILQETYIDNTFHGKIVSSIQRKETSIQFTFQEHRKQHNMIVLYFLRDDEIVEHYEQLKYGAVCSIKGDLSIPNNARNPHQFDYQRYLLKNGISFQLIVNDLKEIDCREQKSLQYIYSLREKLLEVSTEKLQIETAAWLQALVLGNVELIDEETIKVFQRWSISHILAISGLHVGIVVAIVYMILVRFSITTKETAQTMMILFLPVYAFLAGGQPSVWRASLMVVLGILLLKWRVKVNYTDVISIVFLFLIFINPYIVYHIGFQFSFLVSFGLILSQNWIRQTKSNWFRVFQISFISQMVILPIQVHYFFTFQPLSILLNVIVVPYFSLFVIPILFLLLLFIYLPTSIIKLVEFVFMNVHQTVLNFIEIVDLYFNYEMAIGTFPVYFMVIYYVLFILFMKYLESGETKRSFIFGIATCIVIISLLIRPFVSPIGKVTMLDIGQGDTFVIELPYRKGVFIIDAAAKFSFTDFEPTDSVYEQVIRPYLLGQGIRQIDTIFISHADLDHHGSVRFLLDEFRVNEIIISPFYRGNEAENELWQKEDILVTRANFNEKLVRNNQPFYTLSPVRDKNSENENSLVLFTELGGARWLFTGDIDKETEREIVKNFPNVKVDILKVAHHGSNTSTDPTFLQAIEPAYALISAGVNNRYGHPTNEVIQTLMEEDIIIYRTDEHGAVQYIFKDDRGIFKTFFTGE